MRPLHPQPRRARNVRRSPSAEPSLVCPPSPTALARRPSGVCQPSALLILLTRLPVPVLSASHLRTSSRSGQRRDRRGLAALPLPRRLQARPRLHGPLPQRTSFESAGRPTARSWIPLAMRKRRPSVSLLRTTSRAGLAPFSTTLGRFRSKAGESPTSKRRSPYSLVIEQVFVYGGVCSAKATSSASSRHAPMSAPTRNRAGVLKAAERGHSNA